MVTHQYIWKVTYDNPLPKEVCHMQPSILLSRYHKASHSSSISLIASPLWMWMSKPT